MADENQQPPVSETARVSITDGSIEERLRSRCYDACMAGQKLEPIPISDIHWIAGFLEGEGSFTFRGRNTCVNATQVQVWPLEKLHRLVGGRFYVATHRSRENWSTITVWNMSGPTAVGLMMTIYPLMSPRRQSQILKVLDNWRRRPVHNAYKTTCKNGHPYDIFRKVRRPNGRIHNVRHCSICQKNYSANRERRAVNG